MAGLGIGVLFVLNRLGVQRLAPYIIVGILIWLFVLKSGVHATLAGIVVAAFIPIKKGDERSPAIHLEHVLHPWVAYLCLCQCRCFVYRRQQRCCAGYRLSGYRIGSLYRKTGGCIWNDRPGHWTWPGQEARLLNMANSHMMLRSKSVLSAVRSYPASAAGWSCT